MENEALDPTYLAQISKSTAKPPRTVSKQVLVIVSLVALIIISIVFVSIFSSVSNKPNELSMSLYLRMQNLQKSTKTYQASLKDSRLRTTNSSLNAQLNNHSRDIGERLTERGYKLNKLKEKIVLEETEHIDTLNETLEKARLNGVLDRYYPENMVYEISTIIDLLNQTFNATRNDEFKELLEKIFNDFVSLKKDFTEIGNESK